jgi:hypothetical protein
MYINDKFNVNIQNFNTFYFAVTIFFFFDL